MQVRESSPACDFPQLFVWDFRFLSFLLSPVWSYIRNVCCVSTVRSLFSYFALRLVAWGCCLGGSEASSWTRVGLVVGWSGSPLADLVYRMAYPLVRVEFYPN